MTKVLTAAPSAEVIRREPGSGSVAASAGVFRVPGESLERARAFWQAEPCPKWCAIVDGAIGHANGDHYDERNHAYFGQDIALTMYEGDVYGEDAESTPPALTLDAAQHYQASVPTVLMSVPVKDGFRSYAEHYVRLTVAEARALRDELTALLAALDEADERLGGAR